MRNVSFMLRWCPSWLKSLAEGASRWIQQRFLQLQHGPHLTPTCKRLQRFLGFANFYRRFIYGFSTLAAPLTGLISSKVPFYWTPAVDKAFVSLKNKFTSWRKWMPPMMELEQSVPNDQKLYSSTFFSRWLRLAERNYDIGSC